MLPVLQLHLVPFFLHPFILFFLKKQFSIIENKEHQQNHYKRSNNKHNRQQCIVCPLSLIGCNTLLLT